eukprot:CAMPEP_0180679112 /NCGR_PEP_ID=MMETSP1037_2-20121125/68751_1 /TAXON_ID=632150 /ORGANISM="Azadinium spinosum, Strain 3D9" /LENGTH=35 /DNA_ID= /DNA_START= /DNA_END= /DNA_ORIENTATION=
MSGMCTTPSTASDTRLSLSIALKTSERAINNARWA